MKKLLCIILATLMLMLPACGTAPTPTTPAATDAYQSPDVIPITDTEKAEIERNADALSALGSRKFKWFDESRIETRHEGWRYYGCLDGGILVGRPHGAARKQSKLESLSYMDIYLFKDGEFTGVDTRNLENETVVALEEFVLTYENAILQREDLDNPYWYGGQDLPELENSIYYDAEAAALKKHGGYLGTYNGYSVYYSKDAYRSVSDYVIGGVVFIIGEYYRFSVIKNGETYDLTVAADNGYLTYENLRTIAYYMYGEKYPEDGMIIKPY